MGIVTVLVLAVILVIQQLQIISLDKRVQVLSDVCAKLQKLNDNLIKNSTDLLELVETQRSATEGMLHVMKSISKEAESKIQ